MKSICIAICGLSIVAFTAGNSVNQSKPLASMEAPSVTHGNTRITLIHMARTTSWSNQHVHGHDEQQGPTYAIPGVFVEFLVEPIGDVPAKSGLNSSTIKRKADKMFDLEKRQDLDIPQTMKLVLHYMLKNNTPVSFNYRFAYDEYAISTQILDSLPQIKSNLGYPASLIIYYE